MLTFILSMTCTSAEMGDSIVIQKAFTSPHKGGGGGRKVGQSCSNSVRMEAAGETLLGCGLWG